ncbi:MAG: ABC-F family ATP-binding cassette domain-containing protein [Simkaniaceae bacterium]|nr:ABC-F family ATP-binding cassette domain-containing protein [Candidatus Sacchlamyda saccharinae]
MSRLLIQFTHLFQSFGQSNLFDDISLSIYEGESFALIGENGSGKTTLLKLLTKEILPDQGRIQQDPYISVGYLPQEVTFEDPNLTARQYIERGPLFDLEKQMAILLEHPNRIDEWAQLHDEYEKRGGYRRLPLEQVLKGLKIEAELDASMKTLSSGQRIRIALTKALIKEPDLLLLDEPTNHLDSDMLLWLEETINHRTGATIIVSHDRKFLNKTCNRLIELRNARLNYYTGNYDFYLEEQKRVLEKKMKAYESQREERAQLKQKIRAITFSKSKPAPPTDRNVMAYDRRGEKHQKSLQRTLDTLKARLAEIEANPQPHPKPKSITGLRFSPTPLASIAAIELDNITKSFDNKTLFSKMDKTLCKGDRIVITGPNGSGKTTLLRCILKEISIDSGHIKITPTAKIAYLDQEIETFPMTQTPLNYFEKRYKLSEEDLRKELHKAALGGSELLNRPFSHLSIGQRKRMMLLTLILEKPNILLLDEPTNHLDLLTLEAFEKALLNFEGVILAISHDSTFIEKIATEIWELYRI